MTMICFDAGEMRFNYRVAGIALHDNQVLLNRLEDQKFWFGPLLFDKLCARIAGVSRYRAVSGLGWAYAPDFSVVFA